MDRQMLSLSPQGLYTEEKAHLPEGKKETEQTEREELTGQGTHKGYVIQNEQASQKGEGILPMTDAQQRVNHPHDGGPTIAHGQDVDGRGEMERLKYYPGFCMQLGAKGRRCMLDLIRRVYKEKTSTCKNILAHKINPPACISNLPFFNINMLWKLSYEFGVFEEALKIHRIYGQSAESFDELINGGYSMPNCSNYDGGFDAGAPKVSHEGEGGTMVKRELSEEKCGGGEAHNGSSTDGRRGSVRRKRKRMWCTQEGRKYNLSEGNPQICEGNPQVCEGNPQICEGVPPKEDAKEVGRVCSGGNVSDRRRLSIKSVKWTKWSGPEEQTSQCLNPQFGFIPPTEVVDTQGRSKQCMDEHGSTPPKDTTEGPHNYHPLSNRSIAKGANSRGEEKKGSTIPDNNDMEKALPNLLFNENCESCRMNRAYSRRSLQKESRHEKKETEEIRNNVAEEEDLMKTYEIEKELKVDSVEELLSNFVHISNAILLHLKKNKGTRLPKGKYNLLSDHCLLLIPINQQKKRKIVRRNAHKGNEPSTQRRVQHQDDHRGVGKMKTDRILHEAGMPHNERDNSIIHSVPEQINEKFSLTDLGTFATPKSSTKESLPQGQGKIAKWKRQRSCSPARGKRKKLASGMMSGIAPVVIAENKPFERTGGYYRKLLPSAEVQERITSLLANNSESRTNRGSDTGKTTRKRKTPSDAHREMQRK
eukprot:XP_002260081.1 hypothetical protein, conserved in Plasmodium species [Plasmodium knowlesi strain H]